MLAFSFHTGNPTNFILQSFPKKSFYNFTYHTTTIATILQQPWDSTTKGVDMEHQLHEHYIKINSLDHI